MGGTAAQEATHRMVKPLVALPLRGGSRAGKSSRNVRSATNRDVPFQDDAPSPLMVSVTPTTVPYACRSFTVAHRFIARLAGPSGLLLEDLQQSHGVSILRVG